MSNSYNYLPIPPRVWSRVQNPCTFTDASGNSDINYNQVYIPLTKQTVSQAQANYEDKLIYKGNILQYKGNSAQFTKSQKYSQLARMAGPNRKKVYATQSQTYTNPNTTGLQRKNSITIPFPNGVVGEPNNISGPYQYNVPNPNGCSGTSLQDGGTLVCGTFANPCTGELIKQGATSATICNPASASDVPGSSVLCWNNKVQTWFPKPRYVMNNSTDKWPVNYKGLVSASRPDAPILTLNSITETTASISWNYKNNTCLPVSSFNIYLNGILYTTVPYQITSYNFINLTCDNLIYVTSVSTNIESLPSNSIISNNFGFTITGGSYTNNGTNYIITFTSNGTISICSKVLYPMDIILVGGGGGGSCGSTNVNDTKGGGGGGGAETIILNGITNYSIGTTYNVTIGTGGTGGTVISGAGNDGTSSIVQLNSTYTALYGQKSIAGPTTGGSGGGSQSNGGNAGTVHDSGNPGTGGNGTQSAVTNGFSYGGGGGSGGGAFRTPSDNAYDKCGGGAGGGAAYDFLTEALQTGGQGATAGTTNTGGTGGSYYGGNGGNPGGISGTPQNGSDGQYGSGGGGGGGTNGNPPGLGGKGGNGFCIIKLPYIY
jgi:hypothetical protein